MLCFTCFMIHRRAAFDEEHPNLYTPAQFIIDGQALCLPHARLWRTWGGLDTDRSILNFIRYVKTQREDTPTHD